MFDCSVCGNPAQVVRGDYEFRESGLKNVILHGIDLVQCSQCGTVDPIIPHLKDLMSVIAERLARKPSRLSGDEIRFLRKSLGLTGAQLGSVMSTDKTTISKWENGSTPMGEPSERLLRALVLLVRKDDAEALRAFSEIQAIRKPVRMEVDAIAMRAEYKGA